MAEEHLVDPSTRPAVAPTLPVHIIPDNPPPTPATSNILTLPLPPTPTSHRYPLCLREKIPINDPVQTASSEQSPTTITEPPLQSLPPNSEYPKISTPHLIPDKDEIDFPIIRSLSV